MPGIVRSDVGCHSVMRLVTSGFVDRPDGVGPDGRAERRDAGGQRARRRRRPAPGAGPARGRGRPRARRGPSTTGAEEEAAVDVGPDEDERPGSPRAGAGWARRSVTSSRTTAKQRHPDELRAQRRARRPTTTNAASVSSAAVALDQPAPAADREEAAEDDRRRGARAAGPDRSSRRAGRPPRG